MRLQSIGAVKTQFQQGKMIGFKQYGRDDLSAYENYQGGEIPDIEMEKYNLSVRVKQLIDEKQYAKAAKIKLHLAQICRNQGKIDDANKLIDGAQRLLDEIA